MLNKLIIKDIVLIKHLDLEFKYGFTVLTGETGTGKSILIDSLGLILGNRANFNLIRQGQNKGSVTAFFSEVNDKHITNYLNKIDIDINEQFIIRREIHSNGKSFSFINDVPISINALKIITNFMVEIQGQFENHSLLNEKHHLDLLDKYGIEEELKNDVSYLWKNYQTNVSKLNNLQSFNDKNTNDKDWLEYALKELEDLNPQENEENELLIKRKSLINKDKFVDTFNEAKNIIDGEYGLETLTKNLIRLFSKLDNFEDENVKQISKLLNDHFITLEEINNSINKSEYLNENNDNTLDLIEERLYKLRNLSTKHRCQINTLQAKKSAIKEKLEAITNISSELNNQKRITTESFETYLRKAEILSKKRNQISKNLINDVNIELPSLKLENAKLDVKIETHDKSSFSSQGIDNIRFFAQTNKDTKIGKINEIASGGELSRFLLAMKLVIEKENSNKTLIFDEVDSGVGGSTSSAIGSKLLNISQKQQTIVITHSPQVASKGIHHILIKKNIVNNETITQSNELNTLEKIEEIARMISDDNISDEARNAAQKLMN